MASMGYLDSVCTQRVVGLEDFTQLQGPYIPQVGPSAQLVASPISSTWGHSFQPLWAVGGELPRPKAVIDEHAFRSFHFRRLLPLHLFLAAASIFVQPNSHLLSAYEIQKTIQFYALTYAEDED